MRWGDGFGCGTAEKRERELDFGTQKLEDTPDTLFAVDCEAPDSGTADQNSTGPECERLDDVGSAADTAVEEDGDLAGARLHDLELVDAEVDNVALEKDAHAEQAHAG